MESATGFGWDFVSVATFLSVVLLVLSRPCLLSNLVVASFPDLLSNLVFETKEPESKLLLVVGLERRLVSAFTLPPPSCVAWAVDFSLTVVKSRFFVLRDDVFDSRVVWRPRGVTNEGALVEPLLLVKLVGDTKFVERRLELGAVVAEPRLDLSELLPVSRLEVRPVLPDCVSGVVEVVSCLVPRRLWLPLEDRGDDLNDDPCNRDERGGLVELDSNRTELGVTFDLELTLPLGVTFDRELRLLVVWVFSDDPEDSSEVV